MLPVQKRSAEPRYENQFFRISRSETAGWGAFAVQKLRQGDLILREKSLFVADQATLFREFERLDLPSKNIALSLHANELAKLGIPHIQAIWATNCFTVGGQRAGLFPIAARFNHACYPAHNVRFHFDHESDCLVLRGSHSE
ncbi:SET domain protein [Ophiocordyceps camponoti-floridani]|uniref:SET domain protein n=1 Tax=Ophiocordyceps camponoti-floridani TaxID=2030778 RepID=A0A8H4VE10_9HYPO|nr:SET domain protein [Ophiocordyceps camponoti-floridani]